jgi:NAD+ kinase
MTITEATVTPPRITSIGVILHPERACGLPLSMVQAWADGAGVRIVGLDAETSIAAAAGWEIPTVGAQEFGREVDLVLAMGGDGTMLRALSLAAPHRTPVLGINLGRLGFMAEVDPPDLPAALDAIQAAEYWVEERVALTVEIAGTGWSRPAGVAYNDVVLSRPSGRGPAVLAVRVDGVLFAHYAADAIIVSTPTGSTAYNFSAGGPIVSPRVSAFLVTPVAPHAIFNRTLAVHPDERLLVEVVEESVNVRMEVDGQNQGELTPGQHLCIGRSTRPGLVVRLGHTNFYQRARTKLQLGDPPLLLH